MVAVKREGNETGEQMIKKFIRKIKKSGLMDEVLDRRYYVKPSDKKRAEKKRNIAEHKKRMQKENR
tara:strand:- start:597 stop:794 length:198 start_codon:yes stop_codon:yes gene_type:complete